MSMQKDPDARPESGAENIFGLTGTNGRDVAPGLAGLTGQEDSSGEQTEYEIEREAAGSGGAE